MQCRVRRNKGFKPINVRLRFDNVVEYTCFRALMGDYETQAYIATPKHIAAKLTGMISAVTGVRLSDNEVEQCLKGIMQRISNKLPDVGEDK